jgi:hypothetical protein
MGGGAGRQGSIQVRLDLGVKGKEKVSLSIVAAAGGSCYIAEEEE